MKEVAESLGIMDFIDEEKVYMNWRLGTNLIHFSGLDDPEKVRSSEWTVIWFEEATDFSYEEFMIVRLRNRYKSKDGLQNKIILSFNPIDEFHWIKERLIDDDTYDLQEIVSNYKDNPFLDAEYVADLEALEQQDISFYNVYTLGQWGRLENLIYKNWDIIDWWPDESLMDKIIYGLDFGFNDPNALVECWKKKNDLYVRQRIYNRKQTNGDLIERMKIEIPQERRKWRIYADAGEPARIEEISKTKMFKIYPSLKNIVDGIDYVKRLRMHIHYASSDMIKELRAYSWRKDRNGNVLDVPVDFLNHTLDAVRYAAYTDHKRGGGFSVRALN